MLKPRYFRRSIFLLIIFYYSSAIADLNLPHVHKIVDIKGKQHQQLKNYFSQFNEAPEDIDSAVEKTLIGIIPKIYHEGCNKMISNWGEVAKGSAASLIRVLYINKQKQFPRHVFLTFLCFSKAKVYGAVYFDERLAILTIDSTSSSLTMLPHSTDCKNCSELTRIIPGDELKIGGKPAINLILSSTSKNPCCDEPGLHEKIIENFYIFEKNEVRQVLSFLKYQKDINHDEIEGDITTQTQADLVIEKDDYGNIIKIDYSTATTENDIQIKQDTKRYIWNGKMQKFEQVKH